jgi:hypothetical protein
MFSKANVGDRVYSFEYGWCRITYVSDNSDFPLCIASEDTGLSTWITLDGKLSPTYKDPTVFWCKPEFELPKRPLPDLKMNDLVFVQNIHNYTNEWLPRHFRAFTEEGRIVVWEDGRTSYTTQDLNTYHCWDHWKLPENTEKTEEE